MSATQIVLALAWGGGSVVFWSITFVRSVQSWKQHHDRRAWREVMNDLPLLLTAYSAAISLAFVVLSDNSPNQIGRVLGGLAWGSFAAAGLLRVVDDLRNREPGE